MKPEPKPKAKKQKIYYKVLNVSRYSIVSDNRVHYKINEWTYPKIEGSRLFVFDDLENAKTFKRYYGSRTSLIVTCHVKNPIPSCGLINCGSTGKEMQKFWDKWPQVRKLSVSGNIERTIDKRRKKWAELMEMPFMGHQPSGAFMCTSVKCKE